MTVELQTAKTMKLFDSKKKKKKRKKQAIKHIKTFSNSAEQHFGNHVISNKELDLYMNFKKSIKKKKGVLRNSIELF